jgi:hypothetical protein
MSAVANIATHTALVVFRFRFILWLSLIARLTVIPFAHKVLGAAKRTDRERRDLPALATQCR